MDKKARIVVVDDFRISREFLQMHIMSSSGNELVGSFQSADEAVELCGGGQVDLVIMDVMMRTGMDGLSAAAIIKRDHPEIKIILVTSTAESSWETKAREMGAEGFWYKEYSPEPLEMIIERVLAGSICYPEFAPDVTFGNTTKADLTEREKDVLRELIGGHTNEEIAKKLGVTVNTVRYHLQNLMNKTGFDNRLTLAVKAKTLGIVVNESDRLAYLRDD